MKFLMYGAGSIGRGFIGPLFSSAGFEVVFVDINRELIDALNSRGEYCYTVAATPAYDVRVTGVKGVDGLDKQALLREIAECDLMATSLGAAVLQRVAPLIAEGFYLRIKQNGKPLNLIICENLKDSAHLLRDWISDALPEEERPLLSGNLGLIEAAIGRMVPVAAPDPDDPLHVTVEEYGFLPVDADAFVGTPPEVPCMAPFSPFSFYEERKLYLHNMGHAICAYLGMTQGCATIAESVSEPWVRLLVQSAMTESAAMLSAKYGIPFARIFDHAEDLLLRFGNTALGDTCERVGRDPMRKLQPDDRLAGALRECWEHGMYPAYIALGLAAALRYVEEEETRARQIASGICGLSPEQAELVMRLYGILTRPMPEILVHTEKIKKELRGNIV